MCYVVKFCYDINRYQEVRHDVNKCNILHKLSHNVTNTSKHVNDNSKRFVMKSKTCHDIDKCAMTSKTRHDVNKYVNKFVMMSQTYDDVKKFINNMA